MFYDPLCGGLSSLAFVSDGKSRAVTVENPTGEKGKGGMASSPLGPSRKGLPCLENIPLGSTVVWADIHGSGVIGHIWMTVTDTLGNDPFVLPDLVLTAIPVKGGNSMLQQTSHECHQLI